jgi:hypothetical protein
LRSYRRWCASTNRLDELNYFVVMERLHIVNKLSKDQH